MQGPANVDITEGLISTSTIGEFSIEGDCFDPVFGPQITFNAELHQFHDENCVDIPYQILSVTDENVNDNFLDSQTMSSVAVSLIVLFLSLDNFTLN